MESQAKVETPREDLSSGTNTSWREGPFACIHSNIGHRFMLGSSDMGFKILVRTPDMDVSFNIYRWRLWTPIDGAACCVKAALFFSRDILLRSSRRSVKELGVFEQRSRSGSVAGPNNEALPATVTTLFGPHTQIWPILHNLLEFMLNVSPKTAEHLCQINRSPAFPQQPSNLQMFISALDSSTCKAAAADSAHSLLFFELLRPWGASCNTTALFTAFFWCPWRL